IMTRLRAEGYQLSADYAGADVVVVNTCGFLNSAKQESLEAIGEAMAQNGRVVVTGCFGVEKERILAAHPGVLAVTGPQQYEQVVQAVHQAVPPLHDPFLDLVPPGACTPHPGTTPTSRFPRAVTTGVRSASFQACAAAYRAARPPRSCGRPSAWLPPASRSCSSSARTPRPMASTSSTPRALGRARVCRRVSSILRGPWARSGPGSACTTSTPIHTWTRSCH